MFSRLGAGLVAAGIVLFFAAQPAAAQRVSSSIDLGGSNVRYADSIGLAAFTLSPGIQVNFDRATLGASGSYSRFGLGQWTTQGVVAGSGYTPAVGPLLGELALSAGGSANQDGSTTGQVLTLLRAHAMRANQGAWVGGGVGRIWDGVVWRTLTEVEAGLWSRPTPNTTILATVSPTFVGDSVRYSDAELAFRWNGPRVDVGTSAGTRMGGPSGSTLPSVGTWGSVNVAAWLTPAVAVVGAVGTYPVDLTQGFPGGRFVSLGLRIGTRALRAETDVLPRARPASPGEGTADVVTFVVVAAQSGRRTVRVRALRARTVELNADFTGWLPTALARAADGWWSITLPMTPGPHQVNIRLDGSAWLVPPGLTSLRDEFGGEVGLVIVP